MQRGDDAERGVPSGRVAARRLLQPERAGLLVAEAADHDYERVLTAVDMSPACARAVTMAKAVAPDAALPWSCTGEPGVAEAGAVSFP